MATKPEVTTTPKPRKSVSLTDRIKNQLDSATLRKKVSIDDLSDLEQHIKRLAVFLGAPA